jgi:hypothetical protein
MHKIMNLTTIVIIVDCDNSNIVYPAAVSEVKQHIITYFGERSIECNAVSIPTITLNCEVTQKDIDYLNKKIDHESIHLLAFVNFATSSCKEHNIYFLPS